MTARQLSIDEALDRLDAALKVVDRRQSMADLSSEVLREAASRRHSVYDLFYIVLARREGGVLLTIDGRLRKLAVAMGLTVQP